MPVCSRCGVAFIDGESHTCEPRRSPWSNVAMMFLALVLGFLLQFPLVFLGERMRSQFFNGWTFWHLTFGFVWPALTILMFALLTRLRRNMK